MRFACPLLTCLLVAAPAFCGVLDATVLETWADVQDRVTGGFEFFARGDTDHVRLTRANPPVVEETPYDLWTNSVSRGFKVVYNMMGIPAGISIDDVSSIFDTLIPIDELTSHLLVTAYIPSLGRDPNSTPVEVSLTNLKLTLPDLSIHDVGADLVTNGSDRYLLIATDDVLMNGFILSGSVEFTWSGGSEPPEPDEQWFEVSPVLVPEPVGVVMALLGTLMIGRLRPRR